MAAAAQALLNSGMHNETQLDRLERKFDKFVERLSGVKRSLAA